MKKEFLEFLNSNEVQAPKELAQNLYKKFEKDFLPIKSFNLIVKFLFLNFAAGLFTLTVCPQFGLGPIGKGHDISHFFMGIGLWACAIFCATFYFAIAQTLTLFLLSNREIRWIAQKRFTVLPSLVIATFIGLAMLGTSLSSDVHTMAFEIEFQVIWILAGFIITQAGFNFVSLKMKRLSKAALK